MSQKLCLSVSVGVGKQCSSMLDHRQRSVWGSEFRVEGPSSASGPVKRREMQAPAEGHRSRPVDVGEGDRLPLQLVEHLLRHVRAVPALLLVPVYECCHLHICKVKPSDDSVGVSSQSSVTIPLLHMRMAMRMLPWYWRLEDFVCEESW